MGQGPCGVNYVVRTEDVQIPHLEVVEGSRSRNEKVIHGTPPQPMFDTPTRMTVEDVEVELSPERPVVGSYFGGHSGSMAMVSLQQDVSPGRDSVKIEAFQGVPTGRSTVRPAPIIAGSTPALLKLQANVLTPYFDGNERRWPQFVRD